MALRAALCAARKTLTTPTSSSRPFSVNSISFASIRKNFTDSNIDPKWDKMEKCSASKDCPERMDDKVKPSKNHPKPYQKNYTDSGPPPALKKYEAKSCPKKEPPPRPRKESKAISACGGVAPADDMCSTTKAKKKVDKCLKIVSLHCPAVRVPTKCVKNRPPPVCVRVKAPLPSFHECLRNPVPPLPPDECQCLNRKNVCPGPLADR